jgi:hypothetical protein
MVQKSHAPSIPLSSQAAMAAAGFLFFFFLPFFFAAALEIEGDEACTCQKT